MIHSRGDDVRWFIMSAGLEPIVMTATDTDGLTRAGRSVCSASEKKNEKKNLEKM